MANYIIEGTIKEVTSKENECVFKLNGTEGYSVKHEKKQYNILYSENINAKKDKNAITSFILLSERSYKTISQNCLLATALTSGKRVRITINAEESEVKTGVTELLVDSITLLSD